MCNFVQFLRPVCFADGILVLVDGFADEWRDVFCNMVLIISANYDFSKYVHIYVQYFLIRNSNSIQYGLVEYRTI